MSVYVIDIETDGLVSNKVHVMSVGYTDSDGKWQIKSTSNYDDMIKVMSDSDNTVIGHNFKMFDAVELERVLNFKIQATIIDTLALSWYIYPNRKTGTFGLASFGEDYGIEKPDIEDWDNLSYEEYKHRCEEDVKITINLWTDIKDRLINLYGSWEEAQKFIRYLMFKMDCIVHQQLQKCKVNVSLINENINILKPLLEEKENILQKVMPLGNIIKTKPKVMYKKDKSISVAGQKWFDYLKKNEFSVDVEEVREPANPGSPIQLKEWLFSLGWKPVLFKDGANGPVPQIRDDNKQLCKSILKLTKKEPAIEHLDGLTVIIHRLGVLKSFIESVDEKGYVVAGMNGFTNTLRLKHKKPIANLPKVTNRVERALKEGLSKQQAVEQNLRDGQIIRECIVAPKGYELCGSDVVSLEDQTKLHFIWDYDPEYVTEQMEEEYDPHLSLAVYAGAITEKQVEQHKLYSSTGGKEGTSYKEIRDIYKTANYACVYKVGAPKLSKSTGLTQRDSKKLIRDYWNRNWSIKHLPRDITTKVISNQMWLQNPINMFWYSVREERNIFSVLNQSAGSFVFDIWLKYMSEHKLFPFISYHDEILLLIKTEDKKKITKLLKKSIKKANNILGLNIKINIDIKFGKNYSKCH